MNKSTLIKALVAGGVVISAVLLGDDERARGKLGKAMGIASDVEKAIKNPLGTLAQTAITPQRSESMSYYDWRSRHDQMEYELEKLKLQQKHEMEMAQRGYSVASSTEKKEEETKNEE